MNIEITLKDHDGNYKLIVTPVNDGQVQLSIIDEQNNYDVVVSIDELRTALRKICTK